MEALYPQKESGSVLGSVEEKGIPYNEDIKPFIREDSFEQGPGKWGTLDFDSSSFQSSSSEFQIGLRNNKPVRLVGCAGPEKIANESEWQSDDGVDDEEPAPACQPADSVEICRRSSL